MGDESRPRGRRQNQAIVTAWNVEDAVVTMSRDYTARDFQYRSIGEWTLVFPHAAIDYVEAVSKVANY